jgi:cyclopropane fatty-acyl-phospholipid synthase-like methyltransferase
MPSEYQQLQKRKGLPYSRGHQLMYDGPIKLISDNRHYILDIGFGIGYGLRGMITMDVINKYVGCEPDKDSFDHVVKELSEFTQEERTKRVHLNNCKFTDLTTYPDQFDYTFCIEVIEHMDEHAVHMLFQKVHACTKDAFFLSTPDKNKSKEGKFTEYELSQFLMDYNFQFSVVRAQWTNLWILNPINK